MADGAGIEVSSLAIILLGWCLDVYDAVARASWRVNIGIVIRPMLLGSISLWFLSMVMVWVSSTRPRELCGEVLILSVGRPWAVVIRLM